MPERASLAGSVFHPKTIKPQWGHTICVLFDVSNTACRRDESGMTHVLFVQGNGKLTTDQTFMTIVVSVYNDD